ncbi:MAG: autotransporter domain-containing protein [Fusobacteriaceae bacterium]|jgi:outer membrane autotransporter protein|nr:autotransporter domain-containing protein [Fusobacteriaceae bacterium]
MRKNHRGFLKKTCWILALCTAPFSLWAAQIHLNDSAGAFHRQILQDRGRFQLREQVILQKAGKQGRSGSNQYVEYFYPRGLLAGTISNFPKNPDLRLGMGYGYLKTTERFQGHAAKTKTRSHGLQMFAAYTPGVWQFSAQAGSVWARENLYATGIPSARIHDRNFFGGAEMGRYFALGDNFLTFYPHLGVSYTDYRKSAYGGVPKSRERVPEGEAGLGIYSFLTESILLSADFTWRHEFEDRGEVSIFGGKISRQGADRNTGAVHVSVACYTSPDFALYVQYDGVFGEKNRRHSVGVGMSHNF